MRRALAVVALLALASAASASQFTVGNGASVDLGTGALGLGCANLNVAGTLSAGTVGFTGGRNVVIDPTGVVNGNSATLQLAGDWDNSGSFNAGTSTVQIADGCGLLSGVVAGSTTFAGLTITSASARQVSFEAGSTTTVTGNLSLAGQSGALLKIRSTLGGSAGFLFCCCPPPTRSTWCSSTPPCSRPSAISASVLFRSPSSRWRTRG